MEATYTKNVLPLYFGSLAKMPQFNDFKTADELLESITGFQKRFGSKVMPSEEELHLKYCIINMMCLIN
jgi:hypothetical protein